MSVMFCKRKEGMGGGEMEEEDEERQLRTRGEAKEEKESVRVSIRRYTSFPRSFLFVFLTHFFLFNFFFHSQSRFPIPNLRSRSSHHHFRSPFTCMIYILTCINI